MKIVKTGWRPGAAAGGAVPEGGLLVSVTDFTAARATDLPGIARAGFRLRRAWPSLDGAVGMWLWTIPHRRRTGSVAIWRDTAAMHAFVGLPEHVAIMRHYRERGTTRAGTWTVSHVDPDRIWTDAEAVLLQRGAPGPDRD
ncbi:hypothetical protein [Embleya sp. NBC_00896]|uniref:hypothetical protein n=1 Tax=Embleya sp. NBC_00896 TaxID=2975961 RepID=UPI00386FE901|nr:hypothetical protein OG928_00820 [Embleya sp. NBC_00896]